MMPCTAVRASAWRCSQLSWVVLLLALPARADPGPVDAIAVPGSASSASSKSAVSVDWPTLVRLVQQHPRLAAGKLLVDAARGGVDAAGAVPNPTLAGSVGEGRARAGDASRAELGLALTMPLAWLAQRRSRVDAAAAEVELAVAEREALRRAVLVQLRTLFWGLAYEQARVVAHEALLAQTSALVHLVRRRVEMGEVRPVEGIRVEIELEKITSELESARVACAARQAELALWVGLPVGQALVAVADLETLPRAMARDTALARPTHPALGVARARARLLAAELGTERMARVPPLSVTGFTLHELDRRAYGIGLTVDLPLGNWNAGRIAEAEARLAAGRRQAEATRLEIAASIVEAQAACRAAVLTATRFRNNVVPRAASAAATMARTYELGETSLLEVIDARRTLLDARRLALSALAQAQIDCSRLRALVGEEPQ